MHYVEFLEALHKRLEPRTYLEIGLAQGHSLALSRCPSIGIDPGFMIDQELIGPVSLRRSTSDDYFAALAENGATPFGELPIDFAYIDGMHHFENALLDFVNIERYAAPSSVVAFDDIFPRNVAEAARICTSMPWTGDVFRIQFALAAYRPDLLVLAVDTELAGTLLVARLDPLSRVLRSGFDDITREYVVPDPQPVPREIIERRHAISPEAALALEIWDELRAAREVATVP
jgi:hypothetical protein